MKSRISALMDGEAERHEAAAQLNSLRDDGEARETWRHYHLIGDAMREARVLSPGFSARVAASLAAEPTVMAPGRLAASAQRPRLQLLSAAASLAAVAFVGWVAFAPQDESVPAAQAPAAVAPAPAAVAQVSPPDTANDYLYAHQGYSPSNSLHGVAPYVRMVSGTAGVQKR